MVTTIKRIAGVLLLIALTAVPSLAETLKCAECGMTVDLKSTFTSRIVERDRTLYFCDIGDLFAYLHTHRQQAGRTEVKDYPTREWIEAQKAFYVSAPKKFASPMGWGIASFKDRNSAAMNGRVMDYDAALKAVK